MPARTAGAEIGERGMSVRPGRWGDSRPYSSPRSPSPTPCAGRTRLGVTGLAPSAGLETRLVPRARLRARTDPAGAAAADTHAPAAHGPRPAARHDQRGARRSSTATSRRPRRLRRLRRDARLPRRPAPRGPDRRARGQPRPGLANRLGARFTPTSRGLPDSRCRAPARRHPAAPGDRRPSTGSAWPTRRGRASACDPDLPTLLVSGGSQGARRLNQAVAAAAPQLRAGRASRSCTSSARRTPPSRGRRPGCRLHPGAVRGPDGPRVRRGRLRDLPRGRDDLRRARPPSGCPPRTYRCRSATASSGSTPQPIVKAGGGLLVDDAELTPDWIRATSSRSWPTRARRPDVGGRRPRGAARRAVVALAHLWSPGVVAAAQATTTQ